MEKDTFASLCYIALYMPNSEFDDPALTSDSCFCETPVISSPYAMVTSASPKTFILRCDHSHYAMVGSVSH